MKFEDLKARIENLKNDFTDESVNNDAHLSKKYGKFVAEGWYGFSLGSCPKNWLEVLDEATAYLVERDPKIMLQQIKIKFGGLRYYCSFSSPELFDELSPIVGLLEKHFYHNSLVY